MVVERARVVLIRWAGYLSRAFLNNFVVQFAGIFLSIAAGWLVFGWTPSLALASGDSFLNFHWLRKLAEAGGDWSQLKYRPEILGGVTVSGIWGQLPLYTWPAKLGLGPLEILNIAVISLQTLHAFFAIQVVHGFRSLLKHEKELRPVSILFIAWLIAFHPFLGARIQEGHIDLMLGSLSFLVGLAVILRPTFRLDFWLLVVVALINILSSHGHQTKLYSLVFGAPILGVAAVISARKNGLKLMGYQILTACFVFAYSSFFAFEAMRDMFATAASPDASRSLNADIMYSLGTSHPANWLRSLLSMRYPDPAIQPAWRWHELLYPTGALVVVWMRYLRSSKLTFALNCGILVSLVAAIDFSFQDGLTGRFLRSLIPPISAFRVPERAIYPALVSVLTLGIAHLSRKFEDRVIGWSVLASAVLLWAGRDRSLPMEVELASMAIVLILLLVADLPRFRIRPAIASATVSSLVLAGAFLGFADWVKPRWTRDQLVTEPTLLSNQLRAAHPTRTSLNRTHLMPPTGPLEINAGVHHGLATLEGYWVNYDRFNQLATAVLGWPVRQGFRHGDSADSNLVFTELYNIETAAKIANGRLTEKKLYRTPRPAWSFRNQVVVKDFNELGDTLLKDRGVSLKDTGYILQGDASLIPWQFAVNRGRFQKCASDSIGFAEKNGILLFETDFPTPCPLVVSMNYSAFLKASTLSQPQQPSRLPVFPIDGALTGVLVPPGPQKFALFWSVQ